MTTLSINGETVTVKNNSTILKAAKTVGTFIPTLCNLPGHHPRSVCRLCLVELEGKKKLISACSTVVKEGMKIQTNSEVVTKNRKIIMEFILAEHGECHNENCELENLGRKLGVHSSRFAAPPVLEERNLSSEYLYIKPHLCIHCDRCIRICHDRKVISRVGKGSFVSMAFDDNRRVDESSCVHCRDCAEVCPSGAITETTLFQKTAKNYKDYI